MLTFRENFDYLKFKQMLMEIKWTPKLTAEWQAFYDSAARVAKYGRTLHFQTLPFLTLPTYEDLNDAQCNFACREKAFALCLFASLIIMKMLRI